MTRTKLIRERWLPPDFDQWDRDGQIAWLCHTHQRGDFAVTLGTALGFEPADPRGRFSKAELGVCVLGHAALVGELPMSFASTRAGLIEQLASQTGLFLDGEDRLAKVEVAGLCVAFRESGLQLFNLVDPQTQHSRPIATVMEEGSG